MSDHFLKHTPTQNRNPRKQANELAKGENGAHTPESPCDYMKYGQPPMKADEY